jgi:hypothetical protein
MTTFAFLDAHRVAEESRDLVKAARGSAKCCLRLLIQRGTFYVL